MKPLDLAILREAMAAGRIEWRKHVLQKLAERGIPQESVREVLLRGERIRDYEDDKPFPKTVSQCAFFRLCFRSPASRRGRLR
jgi:hypothetical protein